ncbi:hypothetical protein TNCV_4431681 [Trichonephila clavipes]|nr:hypothetical protein TNCV_4431681 [Trichonephila clavipes]
MSPPIIEKLTGTDFLLSRHGTKEDSHPIPYERQIVNKSSGGSEINKRESTSQSINQSAEIVEEVSVHFSRGGCVQSTITHVLLDMFG